MTGSAAVVLRCPACGAPFAGLDGDRAWACTPCGRAWEIERDGLVERRRLVWRVAAPEGGPRSILWLPFWRIAHDAHVSSDDAAARDAAIDAARSGRSWIRAFWLDGAFVVGDPGQAMTAASHDETLDSADLPPLVGARLSSAEALRLAELFVLAAADRVQDVSPVTLRLVPRDVALVSVPFAATGRDVVSLVDGAAFRRSAIPDIEGMAGA